MKAEFSTCLLNFDETEVSRVNGGDCLLVYGIYIDEISFDNFMQEKMCY